MGPGRRLHAGTGTASGSKPSAQVAQSRRHGGPYRLHVSLDLLGSHTAQDNRGDRRSAQRELESGDRDRHPVAFANPLNPGDLVQDFRVAPGGS